MDQFPYHYQPTYQDVYGFNWPIPATPVTPATQQQPPARYADYADYAQYPTTLHFNQVNVNPPTVEPPRTPFTTLPAQSANVPVTKKKEKKPCTSVYTAHELFDILQTAIDVQLYTAKHGEKGAKDKEFGTAVRKRHIQGNDTVLKTRVAELLVFHEDPEGAPDAIVKAISGSTLEISFGAPLDLLMAQKRLYEDKTDAEKDKLKKKAEDDKIGGEAIRNASLNRSRCATVVALNDDSDDEVVVLAHSAKASAAASPLRHIPSTPSVQLRALPVHLSNWSPPASILGPAYDSGNDSDIEITGHRLPTGEAVTEPVKIKAEPVPSTIPGAKKVKCITTATTPLPSIPRTDRKAPSKKRTKDDDSDAENTPSARKTKHVRRDASFDQKEFLMEERERRDKFDNKLLREVRQGNAEFCKAADDTRSFQTEFLGFLRDVFPANN
ncbi:hypothetical protein B0H10DRAFT_1939923 [Mycena sp. CBHHK59/15]|nr:hypothetical protein B0H10DRAFT_1939923 [Mycena sp. CBHHK59/15]